MPKIKEAGRRTNLQTSLWAWYTPDPEEWFAEMFRLFVTNSDLLLALRPATYGILKERWRPVEERCWQTVLGINVPPRVVRAQVNKGAG